MFEITREPIVPSELYPAPSGAAGVVTFIGIVRDRADDGRPVAGLSYEAFEPMALASFESIAAEARDRFGTVHVAIVHRIGELSAGEIAVAVVVAAAHRDAAFDACRYCI